MASDGDTSTTDTTQRDILDLASQAEDLGLDAAWVGDSILAKPRHEPLSTLAAVAATTDSLNLGTAVYLPNYRHPLNIAHQVVTIERLSGGRLTLGVGTGNVGRAGSSVEAEYDQFGLPFENRGARLDECLEIVRTLWRGEPVSYDGEFYHLDGVRLFNSPGDPSVYVASTAFDPTKGFPRRIRDRITRLGEGWLPALMSPEQYEAGIEWLRNYQAEAAVESEPITRAYYQDIVVADTVEAAIEEVREFLLAYYPGWDSVSDEHIQKRGAFGPPEVIAEHLADYRESGVEQFVTRFPTTNSQQVQLRRYADVIG